MTKKRSLPPRAKKTRKFQDGNPKLIWEQNPSEKRDSKGNSSASTGNQSALLDCSWDTKRRRKQNHSEIRDDKKRGLEAVRIPYPLLALTDTIRVSKTDRHLLLLIYISPSCSAGIYLTQTSFFHSHTHFPDK